VEIYFKNYKQVDNKPRTKASITTF